MLQSIFQMLTDCMNFAESIFNDIMESTEMLPVVIGVISFCIFFRLCITPLFAGHLAVGGSDTVTRRNYNNGSSVPAPAPAYRTASDEQYISFVMGRGRLE